ncbi:glycosyltransferase family 2 protein [Bradyrhizobium sp. USDA 3315]
MIRSVGNAAPAFVGSRSDIVLERLAAQALTARDFIAAFKYADRRCRIGIPPAAHCFVLRAEANWGLGREQAALADLAEALIVDPLDVGANRRMFAWAADERRRTAAFNLIARDGSPPILRAAIAELRQAGHRQWAACTAFDNHVIGWGACTNATTVEATLATEDSFLTSVLELDIFHPLASIDVRAKNFLLKRPLSRLPQTLTLKCDEEIFHTRRLPPNRSQPLQFRHVAGPKAKRRSSTIAPTVIVPVYRDLHATIDCFESLAKAKAAGGIGKDSFRILAVDDASPEKEIRSYLRELAATNNIDLMSNAINLGFVGAVNRALKKVSAGDVVLLNSDTIVAPGFADRLAAVARSAPNIGMVTPLSNNGDIFSFPRPNESNPMPSYEQMLEIDQVAAIANAADAIAVPSGIGFCLYVTRDCLDAVGQLSETFDRGYLEDVDLCLRARAKGFWSVCAPSVYVGHHGSRSFQQEKRSLVLRNLELLDQRFPSYRTECRAFEVADPLRSARARLERALPWSSDPSVLIVGNHRTCSAMAEERARHLSQHGERVVLLLWERDVFQLKAANGTIPQALDLSLSTEAAIADAAEILARLGAKRIEIMEWTLPPVLMKLMRELSSEVSFWVVRGNLGVATSVSGDMQLLVPNEVAKAFAQAHWPKSKIVLDEWAPRFLSLPPISDSSKSLVIVPLTPSASSFCLMRSLADRLRRREPLISVIIAGATCGDDRLMSYPNVFITGQIAVDELGDVLAPHNPGWLLTDFEQPVFGHPLIETVKRAMRPVAYRDWAGGSLRPRKDDLVIPADVDELGLVDAVVNWIAGA